MKVLSHSNGVSLIELMIGVVITGLVGLGVSTLYVNSNRSQLNSNLRSQADERMRAFLESTKKSISLSRNSYSSTGGSTLNALYQNRNCSFLTSANPTMNNCGNPNLTFSQLIIDRYRDASLHSTYFTETITTECVPAPASLTLDATTQAEITHCTPCVAGQLPVVRSRLSNLASAARRISGAVDSPATANIADDGITVASSLCITHGPLLVGTDPQSFQSITLRLRTLVKQNKNQVRPLELSTVVLLPKPLSGGVRVLSTE